MNQIFLALRFENNTTYIDWVVGPKKRKGLTLIPLVGMTTAIYNFFIDEGMTPTAALKESDRVYNVVRTRGII